MEEEEKKVEKGEKGGREDGCPEGRGGKERMERSRGDNR